MAKLLLPEELRPRGERYRECELGIDLPSNFITELRGIDEHLYPVFHRYQVLYDSIINDYAGAIEDPRFQIKRAHGELNFGFVLSNGQGVPTPEGKWHIWRLCRPHGWAHVINIDSRDRVYLNLLCKRLWLQAKYNDKYGHSGYTKYLEEVDAEGRQKAQDDKQDLFNEISKTNSGMLGRMRDNYERGVIAPTNPVKETIMSGAGLKHRSKLVTPLEDRAGGLILPDEM